METRIAAADLCRQRILEIECQREICLQRDNSSLEPPVSGGDPLVIKLMQAMDTRSLVRATSGVAKANQSWLVI